MDQVTTGAVPDDEELTRFGYRQQFARSLRHFESFAVAFSFISITTGIFTTYAFALATGGTRSIWTWPIVIAGQALVALVYGGAGHPVHRVDHHAGPALHGHGAAVRVHV